ncbi:MAG: leucine-rich repeat domain-containing protein [Clostridia bacterium]|nr:leucine-rich repeat domain-containing protein [Clostridia bacterium]
MKKYLIALMLVMLMCCLFAITIQGAETIDGIVYNLNSNGYATITNANKSCQLETVIIPDKVIGANGNEYTVNEISNQAFQGNTKIKYVSFPTTITKIGQQAFQNCSSLIFAEFNDSETPMSWPGCGVFDNCKALKSISLPNGLSKIPDQCFRNCAELTAVYLPSTLEWISGNKSDDGAGFYNNPKMYFVQEPFDVVDKEGNFCDANAFTPPQKPNVYYFPEGLLYLCGHHNHNGSHAMDGAGMVSNTGYDDLAITKCQSLNSVLVLPEGFTGFDDVANKGNPDQRGDTVGSGLIRNCATSTNPITLVFMGKIDRVSMDRKSGGTQYMTYVFANEANTSFENTKIGTWFNTSDSGYQNQNEMYVVFCHANNGEGAKYRVGFTGSADNSKYPVLTSELQNDAIIHTESPILSKEPEGTPCPHDNPLNTFCFCGKALSVNAHELDLSKGASEIAVTYENYFANGLRLVKCADCDHNEEILVNPIITSFKGYSVREKGNGIVVGYTLDKDALKEYERVNKKALEYGFVLAVKSKLGANAPLDENGKEADGVVKATMTSTSYTGVEIKLSGDVWDNEVTVNGEKSPLKDLELILCGYIYDGSVCYIQKSDTTIDYQQVYSVAYQSLQ